ncbi:MAG TPA: hypothetical protein PLL71_01305 [Agriterribacter sp.]|nr:hypothetical protein [Agriterribacter sp.]HRQ49600.1 hypothetical protein [Agriterribacter sp.]
MTKTKVQKQLRLRVFAGPNGSGKSTVIYYVRKYKASGKGIDFGYYINADDIALTLRKNGFSFTPFDIAVSLKEFNAIAMESGLIGNEFPEIAFKKSFSLRSNLLQLKNPVAHERLAQIVADFLRKKLLLEKKRFSFETVFSHQGKLDIMKQAVEAGYKVYLYFVSTESPEINKFRILARTRRGGHDVPADKVVSRYYRSLNLLYDAAQLSYQAYFFDNSVEGNDFKMFAHFKKRGDEKKWDKMKTSDIPEWFKTYYSKKIKSGE